MIIGALKETKYQETRVAITPDIVTKYKNLGFEIIIEAGVGINSGFNDDDYIKNGASVVKNRNDIFKQANILINIWSLAEYEFKKLKTGQILIANFEHNANCSELKEKGVGVIAIFFVVGIILFRMSVKAENA